MTGSARRPRESQVGTVRDPAYQLLLGQMRRQRLRDGGETERLWAAIAILKQEMARMRGEWSPDDPSEWDHLEDGQHLEAIGEPTPAALTAQQQPPPFTHYATAFGQPKPSRPKFAEDEPRPELESQFCRARFVAPERERRLPAGFVLLDPAPPAVENRPAKGRPRRNGGVVPLTFRDVRPYTNGNHCQTSGRTAPPANPVSLLTVSGFRSVPVSHPGSVGLASTPVAARGCHPDARDPPPAPASATNRPPSPRQAAP